MTAAKTPTPAPTKAPDATAVAAAPEPVKTDVPEVAEKKKEPEGMYVVTGAPVAPWGNGRKHKEQHGEKARMYGEGEAVSLPHKLARHYVGLKRLAPFIPDDDEG